MDYINTAISLAGVLVSVAFSYGVISAKVKHIEQQLSVLKKDHDLLVELNTKMDLLLSKKVK